MTHCAILRLGTLLHTQTKQLEATADIELPPSIWAGILSAADLLTTSVFPAASVALLLTSDARIRQLNHEWRNVDAPTDVLSWPGDPAQAGFAGDIAISWDAVQRQAARHGHPEITEAAALFAHGLLHLAGHDHPTAETQAEMDRLTFELLQTIRIEVKSFGH